MMSRIFYSYSHTCWVLSADERFHGYQAVLNTIQHSLQRLALLRLSMPPDRFEQVSTFMNVCGLPKF